MTIRPIFLALLVWPRLVSAQTPPEIANILARLDRLERENRALSEEVRRLREELTASRGPQTTAVPETTPEPETAAGAQSAATVEERLDIQEHRVEELAQTKVESSQRFPIRLTGTVLFNTFLDSDENGGVDYPLVATAPGEGRGGATIRQTILGLEFRGPEAVWGGKVKGSVFMDFYAGSGTSQTMRLRTGSIEIDWKNRSVMAGIEKPIFNPREPSSLAQVGVSPLTGAGNLWLWLPQVRVEQDYSFTASSGLRSQLGMIATREVAPYTSSVPAPTVEPTRPGLEGRFEFFHNLDDNRKLEVAAGFHTSTTHVAGLPVPSSLFAADWFFNPWHRLEFTGAFYTGQNVTSLGTPIRQGYYLVGRDAEPIHSVGGWGQLTFHLMPRLDAHLFSGQQDDRNSQLQTGGIGKNLMFGGNLYYHLAPNVILGWETSQVRTTYIRQGTRLNNHYDLALAYLF